MDMHVSERSNSTHASIYAEMSEESKYMIR